MSAAQLKLRLGHGVWKGPGAAVPQRVLVDWLQRESPAGPARCRRCSFFEDKKNQEVISLYLILSLSLLLLPQRNKGSQTKYHFPKTHAFPVSDQP
jgi:hypothetical protein